MNEHGLTISSLTLSETTYQERSHNFHALNHFAVPPYVLGNCKTVDDAIKLLKNVNVVNTIPLLTPIFLKFHWSIADAYGNSIVVE